MSATRVDLEELTTRATYLLLGRSSAVRILSYEEFVDKEFEPRGDELVALYRVKTAEGISLEGGAARVAAESSAGTWTEVVTMSDRIMELRARAYAFDGPWVKISYPVELFELGSMPQIWSAICGNVFGMKALKNLRLEDVYWPPDLVNSFPGPSKGIDGVRETMKVHDRPLLATVPKPKVGMTTEEHANAAYEIMTGGVDLVKDDENLTSQNFNRFDQRSKETLRMRDKAEAETGERRSYLVNITAPFQEMKRRAELVADLGGEFIMIDILTAGWASVQEMRALAGDLGLAIHAHRAFHSAFTRNEEHGISMKLVAESARLVGVDQIHVGTVVGKLVSPIEEVTALVKLLRDDSVAEDVGRRVLPKEWLGTKPTFPVSSGGLHPGLVLDVLRIMGPDIIIQAGGGVLGHPNGPRDGARAMRQAVDATLQGIGLDEHAKSHEELRAALEKWGYVRPV